jgi:hypothetical protein
VSNCSEFVGIRIDKASFPICARGSPQARIEGPRGDGLGQGQTPSGPGQGQTIPSGLPLGCVQGGVVGHTCARSGSLRAAWFEGTLADLVLARIFASGLYGGRACAISCASACIDGFMCMW